MPVPTAIANYANTCLGKARYSESNMYRGDQLSVWLSTVPFGAETPTAITLPVASGGAVTAGGESIIFTVAAGQTVTLYRDQVLYFSTNNVFVVVLETRSITGAAGGSAFTVPTRPIHAAIAAGATTLVYPNLVPLLSIASGGFIPQSTGTIAEAKNKGQSLYSAKAVFQRGATASGEGTAIRNDAGLALLENAVTSNSLIYVETRRPIYDNYGVGLNAYKYLAIVESSSPTSDGVDFEKVNFSLSISGSPSRYTPLGSTLAAIKALVPENTYLAALDDFVC